MTNEILLNVLSVALEDYTQYRSNYEDMSDAERYLMSGGLCWYFKNEELHGHLLPHDFVYKFLGPILPPLFVEKLGTLSFWFPTGIFGVDQRIELLNRAIYHYKLNPIKDE